MAAPLDGIRVLEVSNWLAAPSAAALMRDLGAEVVKVEPPTGDIFRHFPMRSIYPDFEFALQYAFEFDNRGKQSIVNSAPTPCRIISASDMNETEEPVAILRTPALQWTWLMLHRGQAVSSSTGWMRMT